MRVLLTGAAGGIGAATAAELRRRGARVVGLDLREGPDIIACDVRDQAAVDRAVAEAIERLGGLDVLINNAGIGLPQSAGAAPGDDALAVIDVNLLGPWRVTAAALPALRESRGRVVNVASGLAYVALPWGTAYCMSKRGLTAYSDALRLEYGGEITVTTVYPGYIRTPIHAASHERGRRARGPRPAREGRGRRAHARARRARRRRRATSPPRAGRGQLRDPAPRPAPAGRRGRAAPDGRDQAPGFVPSVTIPASVERVNAPAS